MGALHPAVQENFQLKQGVCLAELSAELFINSAVMAASFKPLPRYPSISRDVAFVVPEKVSAADIHSVIKECGGELLENIGLFDVYAGNQIQTGYRSLAYNLVFQHSGRTLKDEEIDEIQAAMEEALHKKFGAVLRKL